MAVARMKKVTLLGHSSVKAQVTKRLQQQGFLEVVSASEDGETTPPEHLTHQLHDLELAIHKANFLLGFLGGFVTEKKSFIRGMMAPRVYLTRTDYEMIEGKIPFEELVERCEELDEELNGLRGTRARLEQLRESLEPWVALDMPLTPEAGTEQAVVLFGWLPLETLSAARDELAASQPLSDVEVISESAKQAACAVLVHTARAADVQLIMQRHGFRPITVDSDDREPHREIERIDRDLRQLAERERAALAEGTRLTQLRDDILVLREYFQDKYDRAAVEERFYDTQRSFLLEGWTQAVDAQAVVDAIKSVSPAIDVAVTNPEPDDAPPVHLANAAFLRPFEALMNLYGYPSHDEIDPTPYLAPFFFIFFGMALGDFGYGLVLALGLWWAIRHFDLQGNVKNFMHLLIYGGIASMLVGIVTGGYFGVDVKDLPAFLRILILIDPLNQALEFMIVAVMLGFIQVTFGVVLEGADAARHGDVAGAFFDQGTTVALLVTSLIAFAGWITTTVAGKLPPALATIYPIGLVGLGLSVAGVILLQGRVHEGFAEILHVIRGRHPEGETGRSRVLVMADALIALGGLLALFVWVATFFVATSANPVAGRVLLAFVLLGLGISPLARKSVARVWTGAYSLYGMSAFIGDTLSYARLMAIGLATVLIGMVVNLLAKMIFAAGPIGIFFGIIVLLVGHTFNLVINLLGAFVHPTRLQFVEFFGKFYDDGGAKFAPLAIRTKHLIFRPEHTT